MNTAIATETRTMTTGGARKLVRRLTEGGADVLSATIGAQLTAGAGNRRKAEIRLNPDQWAATETIDPEGEALDAAIDERQNEVLDGLNRDDTGRIIEPDGGDYRPAIVTISPDATHVETVVGKARKSDPKPCQCSCGDLTAGGRYLPGHDARHKSRLLTAARNGDTAAREELARAFPTLYPTGESIDTKTSSRVTDGQRAERQRAKLEAKLAKARAVVADLEAQLAG